MKDGASEVYVEAVRSFYRDCNGMVKIGNRVSTEFNATKGL